MKFTGRVEKEDQGEKKPLTPEEAQEEIIRIQTGKRKKRKADEEKDQDSIRVDGVILNRIREFVMSRIDASVLQEVARDIMLTQIEGLVAEAADSERIELNGAEQRLVASTIVDDMVGNGPLEELLADESVTEIMVNGPQKIYIEQAGRTFLSSVKFRTEDHLLTVAKRIARVVGRTLDEQRPYVDARLLDGSRVNIVIPPVALDGTTISIRKFPKDTLQLHDLQRFGALSSEMSTFIRCIAASRCNVLVSGGTSSGKTTLLNTLGEFIRPTERVITIEDSAELKIDVGNLVRLETKPGTAEAGSQPVTQRDLVANSLRMRPDRIILGEVRREEAFDLLQAMSTGHDGSMGTLHSNNPRDTTSRLENMILMGGVELPTKVIRSQIVSAVDFIIHAARGADGKRRVTHITEITGLEGDMIALQDVFFFQKSEGKRFNAGEYVANRVNLRCAEKLKEYGHYDDAMNAILSSPAPEETA
jgi:pilus assembly protein CpaF